MFRPEQFTVFADWRMNMFTCWQRRASLLAAIDEPPARSSEFAASRRGFVKALTLAGAGAMLPGARLLTQAISPSVRPLAGRVDIHHHIFPPFYVKAMEEQM